MAKKKNIPKAATGPRKADKKEKVTPTVKASARTKKKDAKLSEGQFIVRGTVRDSNGKPLANVNVRAFDRDLRKEQQLGKDAVTDADGRYEIRYSAEEFAANDATPNASPDLMVCIVDANNKNKVLAESPTRFNAGQEETIDLVIAVPALSEFVIISQAVIPILIGQGPEGKLLPPWELNDEDINFIVAETGLDREQVRLWVLAAKTASEVELIASKSGLSEVMRTHSDRPASSALDDALEFIAFYGWFRDGQPQVFADLIRRSTDDLMISLERAITQRYISAINQQLKDLLRKTLYARRIDEALKPTKEDEPATFGGALRTMPKSNLLNLDDPQGLGGKIVSLLLQEKSNPQEQWKKIHKLIDNGALFNGVQRTVGLMQFTDGYQPLIAALQLSEVNEMSAALADLAKHDSNYWIGLTKKLGAPSSIVAESDEERGIIYGRQLAQKIELMHPASYVHHRVVSGQIPVTVDSQGLLSKFLAANPEMRIKDGSVLVWLDSDNIQNGGLSADQINQITPELLKIERVAKISPSLEYVGPILKLGYASARDIVNQHSREVFIDEVRDLIANETEVGRIYDAAAGMVATTEALVLIHSPLLSGIDLPVMPLNMHTTAQAPQGAMSIRSLVRPLTLSANLQRLFGSQDYCDCVHGASLYGPAAYLADLLQMLARGKKFNNKTALQVLLDRRPDLAEIDLTGDNTDITLPYIDLVLEILESPDWEAGLGFRINRNSSFDSSLDSGVMPQALAPDIASRGFKLSENLSINRGGQVANSAGVLFNSWLIRDQQSGLKLRLIGAVYTAYRLRVSPQSVAGASKSYQPWSKLVSSTVRSVSEARFPWTLPYDDVRDEANTWLGYLGESRSGIMQAMAFDRWNDIDSACEFLNISPAERTIFASAPVAEHADWGFPAAAGQIVYDPIGGIDRGPADWHVLLKNVSLLRSRARLTHRELLNVLETRFVRSSTARLEITGEECDTALMRLEAMNAALARRIHIFVRMWRKLGWRTSDLDQAIYAYGIGTNVGGYDCFSNEFIRFVGNIARLRASSELSVSQLLDLFGPSPGAPSLDTTVYWDHSGALPQRMLSRYQYWFDNPALGKPQQPEFQLNTARTELDIIIRPEKIEMGLPKPRISDHSTYIAAALAIPESELIALLPIVAVCIPPKQISSPTNGTPIEVLGSSLKEFEIVIGAMTTGAVFSLQVQDSDSETDSSFVDVGSADLQAGSPNPLIIDSATPLLTRFTYTGSRKYLRCSINSSSGINSSLWITVRVLTKQGIVTNDLTLANLTVLCRYAILRRLVGVPIQELRMLMTLSGASTLSAIDGPGKVLTLLDSRDALRTLDIPITQAVQLLCGPDESAELELYARVEALLTIVRAEAMAIRDESTVSDDKRSVLLKSVLTGLGWDERLIAAVLGAEVLGSNLGDYEATLDVMPAGITLPTSIKFEADTKLLVAIRSTRPAALKIAINLLLPQVSGNLLTALQAILAEAGRRADFLTIAQKWMRAKKLPVHRASVGYAPALRPDIPAEWKGRLYYDKANKEICFVGWMMEADKAVLKSLEVSPQSPPSGTHSFAQAIDLLFDTSEHYFVTPENKLTVGEDTLNSPDYLTIEALLLDTVGLEARCGLVLERLLPAWRRQKLHIKLSSALSQNLGITPETAEALLDQSCSAVPPVLPETTPPSFESLVTDAQLLASDPAITPSRAAFEQAFDAAARLLVLGSILPKLKIDAEQLPWLGGVWSGLDLTDLPVRQVSSAPAGAWASLTGLSSLIALRDSAAVGTLGLRNILAATTPTSPPIAFSRLAPVLGCSEETLRVFSSADGFNISTPEWFHDPSQLLHLVNGLELARQMDMPDSLFVKLKQAQLPSRPPLEAESEVQSLRQMALGKSSGSAWSDAERKVLDGIRQRRRDATVDYLVQTLGVIDANDLYGHYLIDPQMNPCMMTSRIKQAISSVQLFIQRCLMNLEPDAPPKMIDVQHWEKYYRMWEANRKVLLYPENWIEPELRDDKTPFFDDVVSNLQQGDATNGKAQVAMQAFLEKLTDFSKMEVVATCSTYDELNRLLITYVFARTPSEPHSYWYRQFRNLSPDDTSNSLGIWTSWQAVGLDIEGNHLFPFVWQGRLFLFWAIFSEKAEEPSAAELKQAQSDPKPPKKHWHLKIAWSEYKSGAWAGRRIVQEDLSSVRLYTDDPALDLSSDWFIFSISLPKEKDGVTITGHARYYNTYYPFTTLFFDGQTLTRADGTYKYKMDPGIAYTYWLEQTAAQAQDVPIDQSPVWMPELHSQMRVRFSGGMGVFLSDASTGAGIGYGMFNQIPRTMDLVHSTLITRSLFSAPSPALPQPIADAWRTAPFVVSDRMHRFFVYPLQRLLTNGQLTYEARSFHFYAIDWPQATRLRKALARFGVDTLLSFQSQDRASNLPASYFDEYNATASMVAVAPDGDLEFSPYSASSTYNFELFFHAPFAIACSLSKNQRFEEARRWFHYIFDPTDNSNDPSPERYWRFRPFREAGQGLRIDELVRRLADHSDHSKEKTDFQTLIAMWKNQPFQPHLVARMRIRSYMYTVVMKYLDNLIAWSDQLFRRDTLEALNEATQLYILAAQILGRRPEGIPRRTRPVLKSYSELSVLQPDDLSNALVEAENLVPSTSTGGSASYPGALKSLYFCVPNNPKLLEYYDRVEDRLFKLRNCMNIDGVVRQLPLFEPAIDPSLLVRAAAAGVDVGTVLADLNTPLPFYRFNVMAQKATELCSEVKALGAALLSAIEKGDAEAMALMRSGHEIQMLQSVRMVKELQLHEAKANMDAIGVSLESAQKRFSHYIGLVSQMESLSIPTGPAGPTIQSLALTAIEPLTKVATFVQSTTSMVDPITAASMEMIKQTLARTAEALSATLPPESTATDKVPMNAAEKRQLSELKSAHDLQQKAMDQRLIAQVLAKIPDFTLGAQGWAASPVVQLTLGGTLLSSFANFSASILDSEASEHTYRASLHSTLAGYQRRAADWLLQAELAAKDIEQITRQIAASNLRIAIASQELRNHDLQTENAQAVDEFMHSKYSNRELYSWMSGQLSNLHFHAYQLAYDVAKRAERCFKHELGVDSSFIKFGYWDNLKKGLLAGENLLSDLKRMEVAYLNQNARELEITKHVSLRQLDPLALMQLRDTCECEFDVPEALFDLDFPGHYFRRIKSVSVSVPCVVGPYSSVSGTLTLLSSKLHEKSSGSYTDEANYKASYLPTQSIATSTGQNDAGVFELNFRDERYLPFEGAGVISRWRFKLPNNFRPFDYDTISDVILHIRYTARDAGEQLASAANKSTKDSLNKLRAYGETEGGLWQLIDLRHDFPDEWHRYNKSTTNNLVNIELGGDRFPIILRGRTINLNGIQRPSLPSSSIGPISIAPSKTGTIDLTENDFKREDSWIALRYSIQ